MLHSTLGTIYYFLGQHVPAFLYFYKSALSLSIDSRPLTRPHTHTFKSPIFNHQAIFILHLIFIVFVPLVLIAGSLCVERGRRIPVKYLAYMHSIQIQRDSDRLDSIVDLSSSST